MSESIGRERDAIRQMIKLDYVAIYFRAEPEIAYLFDRYAN
jgi:hypothetical protein